jgi:hypothetical protein
MPRHSIAAIQELEFTGSQIKLPTALPPRDRVCSRSWLIASCLLGSFSQSLALQDVAETSLKAAALIGVVAAMPTLSPTA